VPATITEVAAAPVKAAGRGRGKGKLKGRGKFKGKAKKAAADQVPKEPRAPKVNLRTQVETEVGDRDIEEVIKEARAKVEQLQAAVAKAQEDEIGFEKDIGDGKVKMQEASARVDECVHKETLALEKLKVSKKALIDAQRVTAEKRLAFGDEDNALHVLENEGEQQKKEADLLKEKADALAAKDAAKKAYDDAVLKAKEVAESLKAKRQALAITDDPEAAEKAKAEAVRAVEEEKMRKEAKTMVATAEKDLKAQNKELERERANRDKERAKAFKEAAGLGPKKRAGGEMASPAKAAKIQDVD